MAAPEALDVQDLVKELPALTEGGAVFTVAVTEAEEVHPEDKVVLVTV